MNNVLLKIYKLLNLKTFFNRNDLYRQDMKERQRQVQMWVSDKKREKESVPTWLHKWNKNILILVIKNIWKIIMVGVPGGIWEIWPSNKLFHIVQRYKKKRSWCLEMHKMHRRHRF